VAGEFADELALAAELDDAYPGDPGVVVAMLMNLVTLARGEAVFVGAGVLHAYLEGLGLEIMAASDNVLRGGLTPKHIDVEQLVDVLVPTTGTMPIVRPDAAGIYAAPASDFVLRRVVASTLPVSVDVAGTTIVAAVAGSVVVGGATDQVTLGPGDAAVVTADERVVRVSGDGELFVAMAGPLSEGDTPTARREGSTPA